MKGKFHAPGTRSHDFLGAAALALGVICAGITAATIYVWRDVGQYRASLSPHITEGAMGFSLNFYPWLLTLCSVGVGTSTVALLVASCIACCSARQPQLTMLHVATVLSLGPFLYLILRFTGVSF